MSVKVRERPKGSKVYWLFIDHAGRRKAKRVGDKKAAELAATKIRAKLAEGNTTVFDPPAAPVPTFGQYAEHWLTGVAGIRCQLSTLEQYRYRLRARLLPHLKDLPLTAITRDRIKTLVAQEFKAGNRVTEGRPISPETVRAFMATLTEILNSAVDDGLIASNPAVRWGKVVRHEQTEVDEVEVFTAEELTTLLEVAEQEFPAWSAFVLCLARTGLRLGEALALQWADVDWRSRVLLVRRSTRRGETKVTKNGKARRVDMSRQLIAVLRDWQSLQEAEAAVRGRELAPWVFSTPEGNVRAPDIFRRVIWAKVLKQAGLRYRKPHTLRHTYASLLIQAGEPLTYVQQQLGHHSPAFTLAVYGHFIPRADHRAVDRLDDATARNPRATTTSPAEEVRQSL